MTQTKDGGRGKRAAPRHPRPTQDPLAEKHRSAHFDKNWRTVNYAKLSPVDAASEPLPNHCRESDLLRDDWSPTGPGEAGEPYVAKFGSFVGGPFHAEVVRLPESDRSVRSRPVKG